METIDIFKAEIHSKMVIDWETLYIYLKPLMYRKILIQTYRPIDCFL